MKIKKLVDAKLGKVVTRQKESTDAESMDVVDQTSTDIQELSLDQLFKVSGGLKAHTIAEV